MTEWSKEQKSEWREKAKNAIRELRNHGNGAHVHAANKSSYYLEHFLKKDNTTAIIALMYFINNALTNNEWKQLSIRMSSWF